MSREELKDTVSSYPTGPGVYIMKDEADTVLYIGKAKNLRARLRSYFVADVPVKTKHLIAKVARIDYLLTGNEYEALLLENNLIKTHTPRYNINLKDGKSYPVIRITNDEYPRVFRTRRIVQDGSQYFGPYTHVWTIEAYLDLIDRLYPLRRCRTTEIKPRTTPCLYYHIGRCAAVCAGKTDHDEYLRRIESIRALLSGKTGGLRSELAEKMRQESTDLNYEKAAVYRDALSAIDQIESEQRIVDFDPQVRDYIGYAEREGLAVFVVFQMRGGKLVGSNVFHAEPAGFEQETLIEFVLQFYGTTSKLPNRLYTSSDIGDSSELARYFKEEHDREVAIRPPETSRDASVLRLCTENARQELEKRLRERGDLPALEELAQALTLDGPPLRIEGFDIAHVGGTNTVASLVSFSNGVPDKSAYRRFKIKTLKKGQIDDFAAMREVLARRYTRVKNERLPRPDLILVDGGLGQVGAAVDILSALELKIPVVGLAKRNEELFIPGQSDPVVLPEGTPALRVLQFVRDEAHRFATTYRAGLQQKDIVTSTLERIRGIGPRRAARLLRSFPTPESVIETPIDIIAKSTGISEELAGMVREAVRTAVYGE